MDDTPIIPFKIFGLHRTGSNLMVALTTSNFAVHSLEAGGEWKHGPIQVPNREWNGIRARFILCVRNPYAWAVSCYRYFRRANGSDRTVADQFQRDPSVSFEDFALSPMYQFSSPIDRWNRMNQLWLNTLPPERTAIVRQEDQLEDQVRVLEAVEQKLRFIRKQPHLMPIKGKVDVNARVVGDYDKDYYVDREYMLEYPTSLLALVNEQLDPALMRRFNYPYEQWTLTAREVRGMKITVRPRTSDAGDARELTFDPYQFERIRKSGYRIQQVVDVGAHIGETSIWARMVWPKCRVFAYEPCPENFRVLRINSRRIGNVIPVQAAVTDGSVSTVPFSFAAAQRDSWSVTADRCIGVGFDSVPAVTIQHALNEFGKVDLLKVGCPSSLHPVLRSAAASGALAKIGWICGRLPDRDCSPELQESLSATHSVNLCNTPFGRFLCASPIT